MERTQFESRDNGRTPFQWDSTKNAGFSTGSPWLKVNPNYKTVNQDAQQNDPNSTLNYFRKIVKFRKENPALVYGQYTLLDKNNPDVYAYMRELNGVKFLILLNFTKNLASVKTGLDLGKARLILGNYSDSGEAGKLRG